MTLTNEDLKAISDLLDEKLNKRLSPINSRLDSIESRLDNVEGRLNSVESRLDKLEADVASLKVGQMEIKRELYRLDRRIADTYKVALDAWGQGIENRTLFMGILQYKTTA